MHPPTLSLSPHLTFPLSPLPTFSLPFASKSFSDRIFFINFEAKFVTTEKYE